MSRKAIIDTNILLDAAMSERPDWEFATMLLDEVAYGNLEGFIAATSLKDAYFVLSKYAGEQAARSFADAAIDAFELVAVDSSICRIAARSNEPDFEDGIIRACAEREQVDFIISRDEKAFFKSPIKRLSARDYVALFCEYEEVELGGQLEGQG